MIISRTPLRISFVGGGTDFPEFYQQHGGAVVSTSIDKWIHVIVASRFEQDVRVSYSRTEIVSQARDVEHEFVREAMRLTGIPRGVDIATLADVPSHGTGLGSSSAVTVGLLGALYAFQSVYKSPLQLAEEASQIEIDILEKPVGRQDHYAASVGGFNLIEFLPRGGGIKIQPIIAPAGALAHLHRSLMLFYTGRQRSAGDVLREQAAAIGGTEVDSALLEMRDLAYETQALLGSGNVEGVGGLLDRNWRLKQTLSPLVSDAEIDGWYESALAAGASGGKILGAGAGGFLLIFARDDRQAEVRRALRGLREVPFRFTARGSQIVYVDRPI